MDLLLEMLISFFTFFAEVIGGGIEHFLKGWHWFEKLLLLTIGQVFPSTRARDCDPARARMASFGQV